MFIVAVLVSLKKNNTLSTLKKLSHCFYGFHNEWKVLRYDIFRYVFMHLYITDIYGMRIKVRGTEGFIYCYLTPF